MDKGPNFNPSIISAMRGKMGLSQGGKSYRFGAFALLLTLISLFLSALILVEYRVLDALTMPILIVMLLGGFGLILGFTSMRPAFSRFSLTVLSSAGIGFIGLFAVVLLSGFFGTGSGFGILGVPLIIGSLLMGAIGVYESCFWLGIQAPIRTYWARDRLTIPLFYLLIFAGGVMWHSVMARTLYLGPIFENPGYALFVGGSWIVFSFLFDLTKDMGSGLLTHFIWNFGLTMLQGGFMS